MCVYACINVYCVCRYVGHVCYVIDMYVCCVYIYIYIYACIYVCRCVNMYLCVLVRYESSNMFLKGRKVSGTCQISLSLVV